MTDTSTQLLEPDRISFPKLGIELNVTDTAFTVFGIDIKWYGLLITAGLLLAMLYGFSQMKHYGIDSERAIDAVIAGVIGAIIGARAYYVIMEWDSYGGNWKEIFNLRNGGLAIYGGIIGALLCGGIVARLRKVRILPMLDILGIGLLLGQGIGRWGNFTNHEAFGYNTDNVFGMTSGKIQRWIIDHVELGAQADIAQMKWEEPVHPCFLYESIWCLLGFALFALFAKKIRRFDGQIFLMYLIWYGSARFFIEGWRTDSLYIGQLRVSQALSAILVIGALITLIVVGNKVHRMGEDYVLYVDSDESKELLRQAQRRAQRGKSEKVILAEGDEDTGITDSEDDVEDNDDNDDVPEEKTEEKNDINDNIDEMDNDNETEMEED